MHKVLAVKTCQERSGRLEDAELGNDRGRGAVFGGSILSGTEEEQRYESLIYILLLLLALSAAFCKLRECVHDARFAPGSA